MKKNKILLMPIIIMAVNLIFVAGISIILFCSFKYPYIADGGALLYMILCGIIPALISAVYIFIFMLIKKRLKPWLKNTLTIIISVAAILVFILFSLKTTLLMAVASPFGSQTTNVNNYLQIDKAIDFAKLDIFPEKIPESAENTKYFYRYRDMVEEDFDIYLKVDLSKSDFAQEEERIKKDYPNAELVQKDGAVEYRIAYDETGGYDYKFVSFSENNSTVEYVVSYSLEGYSVGTVPYFKEGK